LNSCRASGDPAGMNRGRGFLAALIVACLIVGAGGAWAQDYDRVAPKEPPAPAGVPEIVPPAPPPAEPSERVLLPELRGLRLIDNVEKLERNGVGATGITLDGPLLLDTPETRAALTPFLGKPLTPSGLQAISRSIIAQYRAANRPFVDVAFPEQDISGGVVQAVVTEFRVEAIRVEGNRWFASDLLRDDVRLAPGDRIDADRLREDLVWLNQNPFRQVNLVAEKSPTPGGTDLVLKTEDRFPLRVYGSYDNSGVPILGRDRWSLGFNYGNLLGLDQQLSYQLTTGNDFWHHRADVPGFSSDPTFQAHAVNYIAPLPWRDKLAIFGAYEEAVPRGASVTPLDIVGISGQASTRYIMPFAARPNLVQDLQFGYDFKTSNNNLAFGGTQISTTYTEIDQFPLIYDATIVDAFGQTALQNTLVLSPGNITGANKDAAFQSQAGNPFARARYVYDHLAITRTTALPRNTSWVMRVVAQASDHNLLPSEQLGAGGVDSVRGYDDHTANGSQGVLLSEELRSPPFPVMGALGKAPLPDQLQLLTFWDYASVSDKQVDLTVPGARSSTQLASVGLGLRYQVPRYLEVRFDYGWQLRNAPGATSHGQFGHVSVTISY
jgi:hemolysin activation/secretion protein